ncbi:MAG: hypothetical protein LHV69_07365 [Elusimicrobia bacterium]|nr:hypothetical protein [Candidatus Obscuribacterium magneticum]
MPKAKPKPEQAPQSLEAMILDCKKDRYKLAYSAIRWAKEIKQKENLPDPVPLLVPRAMREILSGKVSLKDVEKLPMMIKMAPPPAPAAPTLTLNVPAGGKA